MGYEDLNYAAMNYAKTVINFLIILSYPLNFGIYCGMSRQFRETFKELFITPVRTAGLSSTKAGYSLVNGKQSTTNHNAKSQYTTETNL